MKETITLCERKGKLVHETGPQAEKDAKLLIESERKNLFKFFEIFLNVGRNR